MRPTKLYSIFRKEYGPVSNVPATANGMSVAKTRLACIGLSTDIRRAVERAVVAVEGPSKSARLDPEPAGHSAGDGFDRFGGETNADGAVPKGSV